MPGTVAPKDAVPENTKSDRPAGRWSEFWRRYSPSGELPISSGASLAMHVFVLLLLTLGVMSFSGRTQRPPNVSSVIIGDDATSAPGFGDDGLPTGDGTLESGAARGEQGSNDPNSAIDPAKAPPVAAETVKSVGEEEFKPIEAAAPANSIADAARTATDKARQAATDARESVNRAKTRLANNHNQGGAASGGKGAGGAGGGKGQGGGGGNGATGRAARPSRWVLRFNTSSTKDYLAQFEGLGATLAFPGRGDDWFFFPQPASNPSRKETRGLENENRLYWVDENPQTVTGVAAALGMGNANTMIAFLPESLEKKMLRLELQYRNLEEDEIDSTTFAVSQRGGGYDIEVIQQIPK